MAGKKKISWFYLGALVLAGVLTGLTVGLMLSIGVGLPEVEDLENFEPGAATRILSADGQVLGELFVEKRWPLDLEAVPAQLRHAVVAVEDRRYYRHPGIDFIRNVAALIHDVMAGGMEQGASTITQQLARNLFLTPKKTISRKLKEIFLALQIERRYTKEEILRLYLNQIPMGVGAFGMGAAADVYFDKDVSELTLGECALLAGLAQNPDFLSPFKHPDRALARRRIVLAAMVRNGYIAQEEADRAAAEPLHLVEPRRDSRGSAPFVVEYVRNALIDELKLDENQVYKGGLIVETTIDARLQELAGTVLQKGLAEINRDGDLAAEPVQGAVIALQVGEGAVLAWVGGPDFQKSSFDRLARAAHPPGSAFAPLVYAAALESGITQADRILDAPTTYDLPGAPEPWQPLNYNRLYEGEITLRRALEISANIPTVKLLARIGPDNFLGTAQKLGLTADPGRSLRLALGDFNLRLPELASAYGAFADRGIWSEPYLIVQVKDRSGRVIHRSAPERRAALSPETAFILTDMLQGVILGGTAQRASVLGRPLAGMTGTTPGNKGALFIGYSPSLLAGVWTGYDSGKPLEPKESAARTALPIWIDFMDQALKNRPVESFDQPVGVVTVPINRHTGASVDPDDPQAVQAAFRKGTEPASR